MPRVTIKKSWKQDCTQWVNEYPLLAIGVFEAGNSYDVPPELASLFERHGVIDSDTPPEPTPESHTLDIPE